jgi:hypothetical protein
VPLSRPFASISCYIYCCFIFFLLAFIRVKLLSLLTVPRRATTFGATFLVPGSTGSQIWCHREEEIGSLDKSSKQQVGSQHKGLSKEEQEKIQKMCMSWNPMAMLALPQDTWVGPPCLLEIAILYNVSLIENVILQAGAWKFCCGSWIWMSLHRLVCLCCVCADGALPAGRCQCIAFDQHA